jgi:dTDP-glucose 4,6-dehydratase
MQILLIPFAEHQFEGLHLAAESHVDRSITDPLAFVKQMS